MDFNLILLSIDELRPDHLRCYGYQKIETPSIDQISKEGVLFETCISSSSFTPICCASILTGVHPDLHGIRDPFCTLGAKSIAQYLKEKGLKTAAWVGNGLLGTRHGYQAGFEQFAEPKAEESWGSHQYKTEGREETAYGGYWWVEEMLQWVDENSSSPFFVWGHFFETHEGAQYKMLEEKRIEEGRWPEFGYYDAKVDLVDKALIKPLIDLLRKRGVWEKTFLVFMGDHGTTMGEHPAKPIPWRWGTVTYPQHMSLYDVDLKVPLLMKGPGLPQGRRVKGMVRSIDVMPTLLDLFAVSSEARTDGVSLLPFIERGEASGLQAYCEELYEKRGPGALQALRTDEHKFIRNLTTWKEWYYDLSMDPGEKKNLLSRIKKEGPDHLSELRQKLNLSLWKRFPAKGGKEVLSKGDREVVEARLRALGYVK